MQKDCIRGKGETYSSFNLEYTILPKNFKIIQGDCMNLIGSFPDKYFNAIFADPPYFLSNGGISVHSGKAVCVDKGEWDKGGTP